MATTIGTLAVTISANSKKFTQGMQKASGVVGRFKKSMSGVKGLVVGLGASLLAFKATNFVKNQLKAIDVLAKTSDRLGVATEELAGLQLAAEKSGTSFSAVSKGLEAMTRRVQDAAQGTGEAKDALERLGIDVQKLGAMSIADQFRTIADAIANTEGQSRKLQAAMDIFSRGSGAQLVNILQQGSGALQQAREDAEQLGIAFNRVDAAQVEIANDAMTDLSAAMRGVGTRVAIEIAPALAALAKLFVSTGKTGASAVGSVDQSFGAVTKGIMIAADALHGYGQGLRVVKGISIDLQKISTKFLELNAKILGDEQNLDAARANLKFLEKMEKEVVDAFNNAVKPSEKMAEAILEARKRAKELAEQAEKTQKSMEGMLTPPTPEGTRTPIDFEESRDRLRAQEAATLGGIASRIASGIGNAIRSFTSQGVEVPRMAGPPQQAGLALAGSQAALQAIARANQPEVQRDQERNNLLAQIVDALLDKAELGIAELTG